ncbi:MAG: phenylalanine--tRNA ligase subunit beta [Acidobacteriota bacterium]|nr:phenylalanine--tRNA ligase subunit beta [Acidobacteriota bacterium]
MRILVSWLRELVTLPVGAGSPVNIDELAGLLTMRGFEVGAVEPWPAGPANPTNQAGPAGDNEPPDAVLDLEITTNRPDCLSVLGIAREVGTVYGTDLRMPELWSDDDDDQRDPIAVTIDDADVDLCPRYAGALVDVEVGPSPRWLAARLEAADVRPINNVVDVTNYVMLELGHPMHAFDLDRLAGPEIRVRRARAGETIRTLDGVQRQLESEMLVIADAERAQAVAGVMGGADSEVSSTTRTIVLEAAYFSPIAVRRTGKRIGLATDASYRFERGADVEAPVRAMARARQLLATIGAGQPRGPVVDRYLTPPAPIVVRLRHHRIGHLLGQTIDAAFVAPTLTRLGFDPQLEPATDPPIWRVTVPTFRVDVSREEDLIEEVARHHGYDTLPTTYPAPTERARPSGPWRARDHLVRQLLTGCGFSEAITYGFIEREPALAIHANAEDIVTLRNPLSEKGAVLRPSLLPGLVDSLIHNRRRERQDIRLFEVGSRFSHRDGETPALALAMTGDAVARHWSGPERKTDLFDLTGVLLRLCEGFGGVATFEPDTAGHLVPGRTACVRLRIADATTVLGTVGQLDPGFAHARGLTGSDAVYVAELDLRLLTTGAFDHLRATPVPRYPSITRDLSIEIDDVLPAVRVRDTIRAAAGPALVSIKEFDRYVGAGIAEGAVSLSIRLTFRAPDRTLTDTEVQSVTDDVVRALARNHQAKLR